VRPQAALAFESCLKKLLTAPEDLERWKEVLHFAECFTHPARGGKHQNLTSVIATQVRRQVSGSTNPSQSSVPHFPESRRQHRRPKDDESSRQEESLVRRISLKLEDGDIRGAVRTLNSEEFLCQLDNDIIGTLKLKHPQCPPDRRFVPSPTTPPLHVSPSEVFLAIRSFSPGSAGGRDGLRPQHLKDLIDRPGGSSLCEALTDFVNLVLQGGVPLEVRPFFFGASLIPFRKKDGGVRPIAVGLTLRRLVAKAANRRALDSCATALLPTQAGVGVKGGAEALIHAARLYLANLPKDKAFIKLDFENAFNSIRRDAVLEAVALHRPDLFAFANSAYGSSSELWIGEFKIDSAEGVQQGDPLGPLLFCLALDAPLKNLNSAFISGYLDDVGLGDTVPKLIDQIRQFESETSLLGLRLNHSKCEIIGLSSDFKSVWESAGFNFQSRTLEEVCLLGAPLSLCGTNKVLKDSREKLSQVTERLVKLSAHEAFFLLKNSLAIPRLQYLLRTAPCFLSSEILHLEEEVKNTLSRVLNLRLDREAWIQASLPVRWGGIGVRSASTLAPSAFLASAFSASSLVATLLSESHIIPLDTSIEAATAQWTHMAGVAIPLAQGQGQVAQRVLDDGICSAISNELISQAGPVVRARLLASLTPGSGSWLQALPSSNLGLRLGNNELRIAVGLRIGCPLVRPHVCVCGSEVDSNGHHGLACCKSAGRHRRHALANDVLVRAVRSVDVHAELEPGRLLIDGKRPDGASLDPWSAGRYLVWDFTCPDTLAPSHLRQSALQAGSAASSAEALKVSKYSQLADDYVFSQWL